MAKKEVPSFLEEFSNSEMASDGELHEISKLAKLQIKQEADVADLEKRLSEAKALLRKTQEDFLPNAMMRIGLSEFKLDNGRKVSIKADIACNISNDNKPEAFDWLTENGFSDLIKWEFKITFGRGEDEKVDNLRTSLVAMGVKATDSQAIHPQTLKAFVKEQLAKGTALPETITIFDINKAVIK